jgi:uncharacterized protein
MPRFEARGAAQGPVVQGFSGDRFLVEGETFASLLLTPEQASAWSPPAFEALAAEDLAPLLALDPPAEFLILGTGAAHRLPPRALVAELEARGIGLEAMDSRAAARAWGMLRTEGRWIGAALMPLG